MSERMPPIKAVLLTALLLLAPTVARAEYRLQVGDVLEIGVASLPELRQRVPVNLDGEIAFPLIGPVRAAGVPLSELRRTVKEMLPTRSLRQRTADGRGTDIVIDADEVTLTIAEYRPVYISGDVAKPGDQTYRPGMTVRQAVALAGGYDVVRFRLSNPVLEAADLRGQYETLWTEFARQQARAARLQAELDGRTDLDFGGLKAPLPQSVLSGIAALEAERLKTSQADLAKEKDYLTRVMAQVGRQLDTLAEQRQKQEEGVQQQTADVTKVRQLYERGVAPFNRVTEEQRSLLLSSERLLQTIAQAAQTERLREEFARQLQKLDDQRRERLLGELQDANVAAASLRARLSATGEKLMYVGALQSQLVRGRGGEPDILIVRKSDTGTERVTADEDAELHPGDVVEIALHAPSVAELPAQ